MLHICCFNCIAILCGEYLFPKLDIRYIYSKFQGCWPPSYETTSRALMICLVKKLKGEKRMRLPFSMNNNQLGTCTCRLTT